MEPAAQPQPPRTPASPATAVAAGTASGPAEIRTDGLVKTYGQRSVVNGVNIRIHAGEVVGLLGPNGAGKTTTFYMVVGLVPATSGRVFINDQDATDLRMHRRARLGVGYLPQEASIFRKLTVEENIRAIVETLRVRSSDRPALVQHHLEELSISHLANQKAYTLSGGERRRLEIARALVSRPRFLLMDEPFAGVDPISVAEVQKIILQLKRRGIGVLITDHNVRATLPVVDRGYIIHKGKVLTEGTSDFLINDAQAREIYLGKDFNL
ncbi:MAG TPA: LPS export ABC transporter ATP-binding protein [Lacunisphaera sp.]|nr:LPS export ABC transporter ATP-binding protein [Lacunisphaera sp.]